MNAKNLLLSFFATAILSFSLISCGGGGGGGSSDSGTTDYPAGGQPLLLVRVNFSDYQFNNNASVWADKIFGNSESQLNHYFREVFYNQFYFSPASESNTTGSGSSNDGIITVTLNINHPDPGGTSGDYHAHLKDAITLADPFVDFSSFDSDNDGTIEYNELQIMFIWAGFESATGQAPGAWAHAWCMNVGTPEGEAAPVHDGVTIMGCRGNENGYSIFGERHSADGHDATIGIIAHELGHARFGLPDLYDTDSSGDSEGIGVFGLMGSGNWTYKQGDIYSGETPVHLSAWSKAALGTVTPETVLLNESSKALYATSASNFNILKIETGNAGEYFLLENRAASGYDRGLYALENSQFDGGVAIWHIDDNQSDNKDETHKMVDLEEAADPGLDDETNRGVKTNLYYSGNVTTFSDSTTPSTKQYDGTATNISVSNVSVPGTTMTVDIQP